MQRIKTIGDLIEMLEELDIDPETELLAMIQPTYPLVESVGGIWVDDGIDRSEEGCTCEECGCVTLDEPKYDAEALVAENAWYRRCFNCDHIQECEAPKEKKTAYVVLTSAPYNVNPYGTKRAWEEIGW